MSLSVFGLDENMQRDSEMKTCQHIHIKGNNANTQCKTKVKEKGYYCSRHVRNHTELKMLQQSDGSENEI